MPITKIRTRTAGSLGVVKRNRRAQNPSATRADADEWNNLADDVIEIQETIGLASNPGAGSIEKRLSEVDRGLLASDLASSGGEPGKRVYLRGVNTPGIGGGDVELVEDAELEDDPVGGVFASGLPNHFFVRPDRPYKFDEEFLAHPSASASDNYEGINRAIHDCSAKGLRYVLRGGEYLVGGPLDLKGKHAFLEGAGREHTRLKLTESTETFIDLDDWDYTFDIGHLEIHGGGLCQTAVKIGQMHGLNSRLHDAVIRGAQSKQLEITGSAVSSLFSSLHIQGGEYGIYCEEDNGLLSAATFHKIRIASTTVAGFYLEGGVAPCVSFYDCTIEGNFGHAMVIDCGILLRFFGGHFEGNCRALADDADILIGKSGIPSYASFYGTDFGAIHANQTSNIRVKFTGEEVTLAMFGVFINNGMRIDAQNFTAASQIAFLGMTRMPEVLNYPRHSVFIGRPRVGTKSQIAQTLADGASSSVVTVSVPGAAFGDQVSASFSADLQGVELISWISGTDQASVRFVNRTGGSVNLPGGTIYVKVSR